MQQIFWRGIKRKGLLYLTSRPLGGRILRYVKMNDSPVAVANHDEYVVNAVRYCVNREEVAGDDVGGVIFQKGSPVPI